jgi:hypothetical protein
MVFGLVVPVALAAPAPSPRPVAVIPFVRNEKLMMVEVRAGGSGPLPFTLDSGARHTVLDPVTARALRLRLGRTGSTTGTGQGPVPLIHAAPLTLAVGGVTLRVADPLVIDLSRVPLPKRSAGLLGAELFEQYIVQIDYAAGVVRLYDRGARFGDRAGASVPLRVRNHAFFVPVTVRAGGAAHALDARIDLGSGDALASPLVKLAKERRTTTLGNGLGRNFRGTSGVYDALALGPYRMTHVWSPWSATPLIGMEVFRRFVTTFDVARGRLYLRPSGAFDEPFPAPGSS